jgi:hypothetical protein
MQVSFLEARTPLTKSFTPTTKTSYPHAFEFKSHTYQIQDPNPGLAFHGLLLNHAAQGHCLLKGTLTKELDFESRAGSTSSITQTEWVCFDFDGLAAPTQATTFLQGLGDPDHIIQYSASHGVLGQPQSLKMHVFCLLDEPISPPMLKLWLTQINMTTPDFLSQSRLTKTCAALSYVLDPAVAQNHMLIYIAPPNCEPDSLDTLKANGIPRISFVKGSIRKLSTKSILSSITSQEVIREKIEGRINQLRTQNGMPRRTKFNFVVDARTGTQYLDKPGQTTVTEHKADRGFVYLNLNGGDSWGYYYPETDNTFVFNFKDEPVYKLQQLDPDFYKGSLPAVKKAQQAAKAAAITPTLPPVSTTGPTGVPGTSSPKIFLPFCDNMTSNYYRAIYDVQTKKWERIDRANSKEQLVDFMLQYGQPEPDVIQLWDLVFDPYTPALDISNHRVNMYHEPEIMRDARARLAAAPQSVPGDIPPTIKKVLWSVVGSDQPTFDHLINWIRFVVCERKQSQTAWLFHGVQGTGKGLMGHKILIPLVGLTNSSFMDAKVLEDKFNDSQESSILTIIDELRVGDLENSNKIMSSLKSQITEPTIVIRKMRTSPYEAPNYNNFMCFSNSKEQIVIEPTDRRYNVGIYQTQPLKITQQEVEIDLPAELEDFAVWLLSLPPDEDMARTVIMNTARKDMQEISMNSVDTIADLLLTGKLEELYEMRVPNSLLTGSAQEMEASYKYNSMMDEIIYNDITHLTRDQLILFFQHCAGVTTRSPAKTSKFLAHHGLKPEPISIGGQTVRGKIIDWKYDQNWYDERKQELKAKRDKATKKDEDEK